MYKILIVDDEQFIREGLKKIIDWDEHGIEIVGEASNGKEALEAINELKPELLLTDIQMPVMNGLNLIKAVRENCLKTKIIIISGYDDFQYVKEALKYGVENYIIKPINKEELSATLIGAVEKLQRESYDRIKSRENEFVIRDSIFYRLVTNRINKRELEEKSSLLGIEAKDIFFTVAIIKALSREGNFNSAAISDINLLGFALANIVNETISEQFNCNVFIDLNGDTVIIFHSDSTLGIRDKIETLLEKCIKIINKLLQVDVFIAIGNAEENIEAVHLSNKSAQDLLQYFVIFPRNYILSNEKSESESKKRHEICVIDQNRLKSLILAHKKDEIICYFDLFNENLIKSTGITLEHLNAFTVEVLACFINTIKVAFTETEEVLQSHEKLFSSLLEQKRLDGLVTSAKNAALELADEIRQEKETPKTVIDQMIEYVKSNYFNHDLSLKTLSCKFNFATPYLGQLLKKRTGKLFSDYLNGIRIEYAKELLLSTNMNANEISEKVGYSDPNYFYRVFKKSTGEYPSEYRGIPK